MEESKFYRSVWRFNALVIMLAGVLVIGSLAFAGYELFLDFSRERNTTNIVNLQEDQEIEEDWQLGSMSTVEGSPYVMIPLNSDQRYSQSYYSKSSSSPRNYLFINSENNEMHWLFNDKQYLITDTDHLADEDYGADERQVLAILYKIVKTDTNGDQRLTTDDLRSVGLSLPNGRGYKEILDGIDSFFGHRLIDKDTLLLVYQKEETAYSARVDLAGFNISKITELPKVSLR